MLLSLRRETLHLSLICEDDLTLEKAVVVLMVPDVFHDNLESSVEQKGGEDMSSVILRARLQLDCIY